MVLNVSKATIGIDKSWAGTEIDDSETSTHKEKERLHASKTVDKRDVLSELYRVCVRVCTEPSVSILLLDCIFFVFNLSHLCREAFSPHRPLVGCL